MLISQKGRSLRATSPICRKTDYLQKAFLFATFSGGDHAQANPIGLQLEGG